MSLSGRRRRRDRPRLCETSNEASAIHTTIPREKSVERFRTQIRHLSRRKAPLKLGEVIDQLNPVIRGWGNYYRKARVRRLFNQLDRWIERRIHSFLAKRWRNTMWRRYPTRRLIREFGLVRLTHLIPGLVDR